MIVRLILSLLLILALPVQGFAAVSMIQCKKHGTSATTVNPQHHHQVNEASQHAGHHYASHATSDSGANKCSSCDACCYTSVLFGGAPSSTVEVDPVLIPVNGLFPFGLALEAPAEPPRA